MCGIAGAIALEPGVRPDASRVVALTQAVAHRGPDGHGFWHSPDRRVVLGHRRLAIIDVAGGQQPMLSRDGCAAITFNGEIYNYKELRDRLPSDHGLSTSSDTEVALELIRRHGHTALTQLRGMFALAVYDAERGELLLARDRIGKKPLVYAVEDGCLYFSSSVHALRGTSPREWTVDLEAVEAYLALGYVPAPLTIWKEARKLGAATSLRVRGTQLLRETYWDPGPANDPFTGSFDEAVDRVEEILNEAVTIRLRSDVPLGILLSGGVDSSLVAASAARSAGGMIRTFTIGFDEHGYDESPIAAAVARHLRTEHSVYHVRSEALELLPDFVRHYGEPYADSSALALWTLARETRRHVTVALTGDGGDEGFAGYPWYRNAGRLDALAASVPRWLVGSATVAAGMSRRVAPRAAGRATRALTMLRASGNGTRFELLRSLFGPAELERVAAGELRARSRDHGYGVAAAYEAALGDPLRRMRYADIRTYLADDLMPKADVASMAHALELRAPLLDHELVGFALSLPRRYLVDQRGGKRILRALVERYLPAPFFDRPKQGFTVPVAAWFRDAAGAVLQRLTSSESLAATGWFDTHGIGQLVREHVDHTRDHNERLFALLVLDEWLRI